MKCGAWSVVIMTLALGCSSVNPHYDPTASMVVSTSSVTPGPVLAQATSPSQTPNPSQMMTSSQAVTPWREDGTRVYSAAKPPVTSLNEALAAARSTAVTQAAPMGGPATQVAMKPVQSPIAPAPVASRAASASAASPYSTYSPTPVQPIASRLPAAPSVTDTLATQAIQQTAASVPAAPANNPTSERIHITSVVQDAGAPSPP